MGDPDLEGKIFTAVTGIPASELSLTRSESSTCRDLSGCGRGIECPRTTFPPEFNFTEPFTFGMHGGKMVMPGPGARPVDMTGNKLDRDKFTGMLKEYYQLRGWDEKTGLPTKKTLAALGMEDLAIKV